MVFIFVGLIRYSVHCHSENKFLNCSGGSKGGLGTPPGGPNSFIFMQFSAKTLADPLWELAQPLRKILDPPLN